MKAKYLRVDNPCKEQWEQMTPTQNGSFCDQCSKEVIDFTNLSSEEIFQKMKEAKGGICARVTQKQLQTPLITIEPRKEYQLPYLNLAAGMMLATTLAVSPMVQAESVSTTSEYVQFAKTQNRTQKANAKPIAVDPDSEEGIKVLKGLITDDANGKPIENAKIMWIAASQVLTTYSKKDGSFSLRVPMRLIDDANVIRVSYNHTKVPAEDGNSFKMLSQEDYILSQNDINIPLQIKAQDAVYYTLGFIGVITEKKGDPIVIDHGKRIPFESFIKAEIGEKSSCDLSHKEVLYFESDAAIVIYGEEAINGLYILVPE